MCLTIPMNEWGFISKDTLMTLGSPPQLINLKYKIMTYKVVEKGEKRETTNIKT